MDTEGEENTIVFWYTLENTTDLDFRMSGGIDLMGKLRQQGSLITTSEGFQSIRLPVFIPAKRKLRCGVHVAYPYPERPKENAGLDERRAFRERLEAWINREMGNLDGFTLFEHEHRYQIDFPKGW